MANLSTSRQGEYLPSHGSWWRSWLNHEHASSRFSQADNAGASSEPSEQPAPWWSFQHFNKWLERQLHGITCGAMSCVSNTLPCATHLSHTPNLTTKNGLFPLLHTDAFGIKGVPGHSQWIFDSGASSSCTNDLSLFKTMSDKVPYKRIRVANNQFAIVEGIGSVEVAKWSSARLRGLHARLDLRLDLLLVPWCFLSLPGRMLHTTDSSYVSAAVIIKA